MARSAAASMRISFYPPGTDASVRSLLGGAATRCTGHRMKEPKWRSGSVTRPGKEPHFDIAAPRPPGGGVDDIREAISARSADGIAIKPRPHIGEVVGPVVMRVVAVRKALGRKCRACAAKRDE